MTWRERPKLTPFVWKLTWKMKTGLGCQHGSTQLEQFDGFGSFMTSPGPECTHGEPEKHGVWPNRDSRTASARPIPVRLPARPICNPPAAGYHQEWKIGVLF
jgi:hypothetical protein